MEQIDFLNYVSLNFLIFEFYFLLSVTYESFYNLLFISDLLVKNKTKISETILEIIVLS